ncbi:MAG: hypothetical protein MR562_04795 [Clostridiaceae bacterium]|nr:hypothetical protein [Clostridiaceae bacterium]
MTALEFVSFLNRYIADKPPNFGDGDSVLTLLYEAYNDANNMDSDDIKAGFHELYQAMNGMPLRGDGHDRESRLRPLPGL